MSSIIADQDLYTQPKINSFDHLAKKPPRERKERKKRKEKENTKEKTIRKTKERKERKREKKGGGHFSSKGEGERECTASRKRRGKPPRATTSRREPPSQPPSSVTRYVAKTAFFSLF